MLLDAAVVQGDPIAAASAAALRHVSDEEAGYRRARRGKAFSYVDARGRAVRDRATLARIEPVVARYLDPAARRRRA